MGTGGEAISDPHKCPERASVTKKVVNKPVDETHSVDVKSFSQVPWFLPNGPTYKVAMVAGMAATHRKGSRMMMSQRGSNSMDL